MCKSAITPALWIGAFMFFISTNVWSSCSSPGNSIEAENCLPGTPESTWDISGSGDSSIQGFADNISINAGQTINFKIKSTANAYHLDIYRMGYYQGNGARLITTIQPSASLPQTQPNCTTNASVGLYDCGNWGISASWSVPNTAVSGIYLARLVRNDTQGASHIVFIVRNDASHSHILFQASDTTWQAYNDSINGQNLYGDDSCGQFSPSCRAYKVSYNRPFTTRSFESVTWVMNAEYPMLRWLEANGYDVTYFTDTDTDRYGALILNHRMWLSNGHDEYWSGQQRTNIEAARNAGVHLGFFSGNTMFWKTRWENSIDGNNNPYRTLVCYKETYLDVTDPLDAPIWTGTWRDARFSPPADGGHPENAIKGNLFRVNAANYAIEVPASFTNLRLWRNTDIAGLASGVASLAPGTLGSEVDVDEDNGFRPAGLIHFSENTINDTGNILLDEGVTYGAGTVKHALVMYRHSSGALVFSTGTYSWSWGLDSQHDNIGLGSSTNNTMQQATVNLFADMGVMPVSLQPGLTFATASTDATPPVSTILAPTTGSIIAAGTQVTITGTASDAGGAVAGVEISTDGGSTWHPASGLGTWTYQWEATANSTVIRSRAVDDSGNIETPISGITVNASANGGGSGGGTGTGSGCTNNCSSIWASSAVPAIVDSGSDSSVELGVKFRSGVKGSITGIRFYKSSANTGIHTGSLWSSTGVLMASATFSTETASGWQQVNFSSPVEITANSVYVASYHTSVGHYSGDNNYFTNASIDSPPLQALQSGISGANGVFSYGPGSSFPNQDWLSSNYWVDVVFSSSDLRSTLSSLTVTPGNATISSGVKQQFTVTGTYANGTKENLTNQTTWSSSNPSVATINASGLATAIGAGTTNLTASYGGINSNGATLSVNALPNGIMVSPSSATTVLVQPIKKPSIHIAAEDPIATEFSGNAGRFMISLNAPAIKNIVVKLKISGNALKGKDYRSFPASLQILAGKTSGIIDVLPVDDLKREGTERVIVNLIHQGSNGYTIRSPSVASVRILDNDK
jgi:hypothetical protein